MEVHWGSSAEAGGAATVGTKTAAGGGLIEELGLLTEQEREDEEVVEGVEKAQEEEEMARVCFESCAAMANAAGLSYTLSPSAIGRPMAGPSMPLLLLVLLEQIMGQLELVKELIFKTIR